MTTAPTDQRASMRPISFVLDTPSATSQTVTLPVRPEDLTRNEPQRATVNQTLGRGVQGWVDHFGEGLPSVTIVGHTGWRYNQGSKMDGFQSFEALNNLLVHQYPAAKQKAIDSGLDPAGVKLLFVDILDDFAWSVVPVPGFVLRRSKSRPLLFQYNITLQAIDTNIDKQSVFTPIQANVTAGLQALNAGIANLNTLAGGLGSVMNSIGGSVAAIAAPVTGFVNTAVGVLGGVQGFVSGVNGLITGTAGAVIGVASSISMVGVQLFRTISAIENIPTNAKLAFFAMGAAFNEMVCIFANALRPRQMYQNYQPLYGASNCSSTTGGSPASVFATNANIFSLLTQASPAPLMTTSAALSSMSAVINSDPVLAPMSTADMGTHLNNIVGGVVVTQ
jgi:hypothetical protein